MGARTRRQEKLRITYRYLTHEQRIAVRTSSLWIAGFPRLVREWHPTKNVDLYPYEVSHGSHLRIWWRCSRDARHEWQAVAKERVRGRGCPFCSSNRVAISNCLATRRPDLATEWHPTKNGALTPRDVTWASPQPVWWRCSKDPAHEWQTPISARSSAGNGCLFCAGRAPMLAAGRVPPVRSLAFRFPHLAAEWHPRNSFGPDDALAASKQVVWWKCPKGPDHEWQSPVRARTGGSGGCPFCRATYVSVTNSLATLHPEVAAEWHPTRNRALTPRDVTAGSRRRVWWRCARHPTHVWRTAVHMRTRAHQPTGCPTCSVAARSAKVAAAIKARARTIGPASGRTARP